MVETVTYAVVTFGAAVLLVGTLAGWIGERGEPAGPAIGRGMWLLTLPTWARVLVLTISLPAAAWTTVRLWVPLPIAIPNSLIPFSQLVGLALFVAGDALTIWGRVTLGRMWTVSTSFGVRLHAHHRLVQHGPFAIVRHPMYLGFVGLLVGLTFLYHTWAVAICLLMVLATFPRRARVEETALEATFGDDWHRYARRVPMWIPAWVGPRGPLQTTVVGQLTAAAALGLARLV